MFFVETKLEKMNYQLAQINIARLLAPLDSPQLKEFSDFLDPVNKLGEESPGFVWRLKDETNAATEVETPFDDDMLIVNMTVWETIADLRFFVYNTVHSYFLKSRKKWFSKMEKPHVVLWWVEEGHIPSLEEAKLKLELLEREGPSPAAFSLQTLFDPQGNKL